MNRRILFFLSLVGTVLLVSGTGKAEIKLPAIFGDHMVLQQQTEATIWGKATPAKTVTVSTSWNGKSYGTRSDVNGNWKLKVKTPEAGGPYTITISDGKAVKLTNVLIGEVWVCSGQSNMGMPMKGLPNQPVLGSNKIIANSSNGSIRLFTVIRNTSLEPLEDFEGEWKECRPESVADFSATAYFFGKMLQEFLGVPVGLINTSWGGTRIEPWMSESGIKNFDFIRLTDKNRTGKQIPTVLYNAMVKPMVSYAIRGGIWYQGEANKNEYKQYEKLMPGLIRNWREEWGIGDFPFYYVQIAPYFYGNGNSAFLREAQLKASTAIPNVGMACLMDVGEAACIHPANKQVCGERLAYLALANTYGKTGFEYTGPVLKEMTVEGSTAKLVFDHAKNGLTTFGKELTNFRIAGENKRFYPAQATLTGTGISLVSPSVDKPVAVRYAFDDSVTGELFNTEGFPASSFRTDDWEQ
ncbi:MAG: sialate O-acetylesterase [Prolixibacteraceae bacterium]